MNGYWMRNKRVQPSSLLPAMNYTAKSPLWAKIMLAICIVLRFCDPILFKEEKKGRIEGRQRAAKVSHSKVGEQAPQRVAPGPAGALPDSVALAVHFLR